MRLLIRMWAKRITGLFPVLVLLMGSAAQAAQPWAPVNDIRLKNDIETLKEYGVIRGPVQTWPIPWSAVSGDLGTIEQTLPAHVMAAVARVRARIPGPQDFGRIEGEAQLSATNRERMVRDFAGGARGDFDSRLSLTALMDDAFIRLSANVRDGGGDRDTISLDSSYGAFTLGNWMLYGGKVQEWWGPGWDSALLYSNNARPMPGIGLTRMEPRPFGTKWLSWLGPWTARIFAARMGGQRDDFKHPWFVGYKVDFDPTPWLSLSATRLVQFCGKGRRCHFKDVAQSVLPLPDQLNVGNRQYDPGNAQGSYTADFHGTWDEIGWSLYTTQAFEDQHHDFIALYGLSLTGYTEAFGGAQWRFVSELSDTMNDRWSIPVSAREPLSGIYRNHVYTDGTIYRRRTLGHSLDFDALLFSNRLMLQFDSGPSLELIYRHADINPRNNNNLRDHLITRTHEQINMLETRLIWPTERFGTFRWEASIADDAPETPDRSPIKGRIEVGWNRAF